MSVEEIKKRYQDKMVIELNKFLQVYNEVTGQNISFGLVDYSTIIRVIGNYVHHLSSNRDDWLSSSIVFPGCTISINVFRGTLHQDRVLNFLNRLKDSFHDSLSDDIHEYLRTTDDFSDQEKQLCQAFLEKMDTLNKAMKRTIFDDITIDITSKEVIRREYEEELRQFNEYTKNVATKPELGKVIYRFDGMIRKIASEKVPSEIFFD